jgi:hypothetical protein
LERYLAIIGQPHKLGMWLNCGKSSIDFA